MDLDLYDPIDSFWVNKECPQTDYCQPLSSNSSSVCVTSSQQKDHRPLHSFSSLEDVTEDSFLNDLSRYVSPSLSVRSVETNRIEDFCSMCSSNFTGERKSIDFLV